MGSSIRVSEKHGVNPTIPICFFCGQEKNELLLLGRIKGDREAPKNSCFDRNPCDQCADYMKQGIILISVDAEKSGKDLQNPYRTGGWCVVKDQMIARVVEAGPLRDSILKQRVAFLPDEVWEALGLKEASENAATVSEAPDEGDERSAEESSGGQDSV